MRAPASTPRPSPSLSSLCRGADHAEFLSVDPNEDRGDAVLREQERLARKRRGARLQVTRMLFSATLTLPQSWKKKVERGKGGYGGRAPNVRLALAQRACCGGIKLTRPRC